MSLQEVFKQIVKETISPLFKSKGFKKSGNNFAKAFPDFSWAVNIQLSRHNTKEELEFTINTGIYTDKLFGTLNEWEPPKFPREHEAVLRARISELKGESDSWYKLTPESDLDKIKKQLQSDILFVIFPYFHQMQTIEDVIRELELREESGKFENPHHLTILYHFHGLNKMAQSRIKRVYTEQKLDSQKEFTKELAEKLGLTIS